MRKSRTRFKKGAASFYIVALSTLILVIIAVSFASVIISEVSRSSNDDLSQSAYDSALAGVEDAKLAFYNYQSCLEKGATATAPDGNGTISCGEIIYWMEHSDGSEVYNNPCDMVAHILGRIGELEASEVVVEESSSAGNNMLQAYTCAEIKTSLTDYRGSLTSGNPTRVVQAKLDGVAAKSIKKVKVSWYSDSTGPVTNYTNFNSSTKKVTFPSLASTQASTPPTIAVQLIQTADTFNFGDFDQVSGTATDRATVYLVPTNSASSAQSSNKPDNYIGVYNGSANVLTAAQIAKTNDRTVKNLPYVVYCNNESDFLCSVTMELPEPIGGTRNDETFMFMLSIPYGQPDTDFSLEFYCADGTVCGTAAAVAETGSSSQARVKGIQINIDSTGRANDLFRRVETRMDTSDIYFPYPIYAVELLGDDSDSLLKKSLTVTKEWNFL
ncbi:hypothetical protein IJJ49_02685 [Candidatus Saccharibacteria bacterium]|nr:hypothetical protein [Candidatus Saccharibacteria bacterium]